MREEDKAYAAGLIDGEGTIGITKRDGPFISMSSTTPELTDKMQSLFGGNITPRQPRQPTHKLAWVWQLRGRKALNALQLMGPYLLEKRKKAKALMLVEEWIAVTPRNGKYTVEQAATKVGFIARFKAI